MEINKLFTFSFGYLKLYLIELKNCYIITSDGQEIKFKMINYSLNIDYRRLIILVTIILAVILSGCQQIQSNYQSFIFLSTPSDTYTFNYPLNRSAYSIFSYIYEPLIVENGLTGELEPGLAESWEISTDEQQIIIKLKPGLKWSDGEPLISDDLVFTYNEIYLNDKIPTSFKDTLKIGKSGSLPQVKKIDNRRIKFSTAEPFAPFIRYAGKLPILPAHILKESVSTTNSEGELNYLTKWGTDTPVTEIISNGMYRLKSYTPNQRIILEKNPFYWRRDEQRNTQPYIENIVWQVIPNRDNQLTAGRKVAEKMATQINQDLAKIGIKINLQFLSFNAKVKRLNLSRDWEAYLGGFVGGGLEPHGDYTIWSVNGRLHTFNQGKQPGEEAIEGRKVAEWEQEIDDLYVRASQVLDEKKRRQLYGKAEQIITEQLPFIYMVIPLEFEPIRNRLQGIKYGKLGGGFWNLYELQISD